MDLSRSILKEFADVTNKEPEVKDKYLRGTAKVIGDKKYVQIDGSTMVTPISETVDVQDGDRVLISIENHKATILGNFTFPPNARKEQEALDKADNAQNESNIASEKAQEAEEKATQAALDASAASATANEAKQDAKDAIEAANNVNQSLDATKQLAEQASKDAETAKNEAADAKASVANANAEIDKINTEVTNVKGDISDALTELGNLSEETATIKETMEVNYAKKTDVSEVEANLKTEISKSVGELKTTVEETYAAKSDVVEMEGKLQSQITQNAEGIQSQVGKIEKLESDTAAAQEQVNDALAKAAEAKQAADQASTNASNAQATADQAKIDAETASNKAASAQEKADLANALAESADKAVQAAQGDLAEAKANLSAVTSRVDATEEEIAAAQAAVDAAQEQVNQAIADAAEANYAADQAQQAADQAKIDASEAQSVAQVAQDKADAAQIVANDAKDAADKAQQDVAALTKRVTSAETAITQNAEAIELAASRTEEIGDLLQNNYYSKSETDAKIKVESDRITSTVSKVETVEKNAIVSSVEEFYLSSSPTSLSGGSWSSTQPTWTQGKYIWRRTKNTKGDGTVSYTPNQNGVCITGNTGATGSPGAAGSPGADGKGVSSITIEFYLSTSKTTQTGGSWTTTQPTWSNGKYLWTRQKIVYINPSSTVYTTPVCDSSWEAVNEVEVGGRNLLRNTNFENQLSVKDYDVRENAYTLSIENNGYDGTNCLKAVANVIGSSGKDIRMFMTVQNEINTNYVFSGYIKADEVTELAVRFGYGSAVIPIVSVSTEWKYFNVVVKSGTQSYSELLPYLNTLTTVYFSQIKLEKGNKPTDWTPAPEDIDEEINEAQDIADQANDAVIDVDTRVTEAESTIEQLSNMIANLVTDENGGSLMTQTPDGWTFNMSSITNNLETIKNEMASMEDDHSATNDALGKLTDLVNDVANKTAYITIATDSNGDPCIELGKTDNLFKVRITNTAIDFLEGSTRIAYANNNTFYATKLIARDGIQIGSGPAYEWRTRSNGNLGLVYVSN